MHEEAFRKWQTLEEEIGRIGSLLHEVFCPFNNDGGCGWYYENWEDPESRYHWYLKKAEELANVTILESNKLTDDDLEQVAEALERSIAWDWFPENTEEKAENLLSLVGNDKKKALALIEEHKHR